MLVNLINSKMLLRLSTIILLLNIGGTVSGNLDIKKIKIWGPGLKADVITMPARYFFVDTNTEYESIKKSLPVFNVNVRGTNKFGVNCRVWVNILDRKDGSFIVRYKLNDSCAKFRIEILHKGKHIGDSPYTFEGVVHPEDCNCPQNNFKEWLKNYDCPKTYDQIEQDLNQFSSVNFTEVRPVVLERFDRPASYSICNYVVRNNEIYRKCYGKYVQFNMFVDSILLSLARKVKLPDFEGFFNLGDWPLSTKNSVKLPIFSWCGSEDSYDIVMPTYDLTESTLENMGKVMLDMLSVQGNINKSWKDKIPKIFWRGRDSNPRRLELIDISRKHPDLFNASLTNFFFYRNKMEQYGPKADHVSFFSFFDYKYQLNIDGTVAAYRFPYLLAGDSVVLKHDSKYYEWFYKSLEPHHYIQVKEDLSDLLEKLVWAMDNDEEAHKIALSGQKFARENLLPQDVFCYHAQLFSKWSEKMVGEVKVLDGMERVAQPADSPSCRCDLHIRDEL